MPGSHLLRRGRQMAAQCRAVAGGQRAGESGQERTPRPSPRLMQTGLMAGTQCRAERMLVCSLERCDQSPKLEACVIRVHLRGTPRTHSESFSAGRPGHPLLQLVLDHAFPCHPREAFLPAPQSPARSAPDTGVTHRRASAPQWKINPTAAISLYPSGYPASKYTASTWEE